MKAKKLLAMLLTSAMIFTSFSLSAFAEDQVAEEPVAEETVEVTEAAEEKVVVAEGGKTAEEKEAEKEAARIKKEESYDKSCKSALGLDTKSFSIKMKPGEKATKNLSSKSAKSKGCEDISYELDDAATGNFTEFFEIIEDDDKSYIAIQDGVDVTEITKADLKGIVVVSATAKYGTDIEKEVAVSVSLTKPTFSVPKGSVKKCSSSFPKGTLYTKYTFTVKPDKGYELVEDSVSANLIDEDGDLGDDIPVESLGKNKYVIAAKDVSGKFAISAYAVPMKCKTAIKFKGDDKEAEVTIVDKDGNEPDVDEDTGKFLLEYGKDYRLYVNTSSAWYKVKSVKGGKEKKDSENETYYAISVKSSGSIEVTTAARKLYTVKLKISGDDSTKKGAEFTGSCDSEFSEFIVANEEGTSFKVPEGTVITCTYSAGTYEQTKTDIKKDKDYEYVCSGFSGAKKIDDDTCEATIKSNTTITVKTKKKEIK